jgi:2-methylcitrate dehydratase PrpD
MAAANGPTARLCRWAGETGYQDIPEGVRRETVTLLYDQLGGMIASATLPSCRPVADLAAALGGAGECSIVGLPLRTSVTNAALANGTIAHGDEVDSTGQQGTGHYAATTVPAAVAMAQHLGATGEDFMRALTLGSEVAARFQSVLGHYGTRPEFVGSVGGTMGAAVSAGLLLGLNDDEMENALGLAASGACGLSSHHQDDTHQIKSLNHGRAAEAAVISALLAQQGYHGPREVMTTEHGFFDAFLGLPSAGHDVMDGLGDEYLMREVAYKRFPVGGPDQTPLYAFLQLMQSNEFTAEDIDQIEVSVSDGAFHTVKTNHHPSVHMETVLTLAAVYGEVTFNHIHDPAYFQDPRCQAFQERARIMIIPRVGPASPGERLQMGITVRTRSGEVVRQDLRYPLMSVEEIQQKFRTLVGLRVSADRALDLERNLLAVEQEENVATLFQQLEIDAA